MPRLALETLWPAAERSKIGAQTCLLRFWLAEEGSVLNCKHNSHDLQKEHGAQSCFSLAGMTAMDASHAFLCILHHKYLAAHA